MQACVHVKQYRTVLNKPWGNARCAAPRLFINPAPGYLAWGQALFLLDSFLIAPPPQQYIFHRKHTNSKIYHLGLFFMNT